MAPCSFDPASIERKLKGWAIETGPDSGWAWPELDTVEESGRRCAACAARRAEAARRLRPAHRQQAGAAAAAVHRQQIRGGAASLRASGDDGQRSGTDVRPFEPVQPRSGRQRQPGEVGGVARVVGRETLHRRSAAVAERHARQPAHQRGGAEVSFRSADAALRRSTARDCSTSRALPSGRRATTDRRPWTSGWTPSRRRGARSRAGPAPPRRAT